MGVYFIAAGNSSKNRNKSLERSFTKDKLKPFLKDSAYDRLASFYPAEESIYLWGSNKADPINNMQPGEFVVDVKNKEVVQIFQFCFYIKTEDKKLQEFVQWDIEKPREMRRPYKYVYFLKAPRMTSRTKKDFFQAAFNQQKNRHWLVGQRYFSSSEVREALNCTHTQDIEHFLGINKSVDVFDWPEKEADVIVTPNGKLELTGNDENSVNVELAEAPEHLLSLIEKIKLLKADKEHTERDHEALVELFFQKLGYQQTKEIKFRRGRIDVMIYQAGRPHITIEVKQDWLLSTTNTKHINQAFNYAQEVGTKYVVLTNGDKYLVFDQMKGVSYQEKLMGTIELTKMTLEGLGLIKFLNHDQ